MDRKLPAGKKTSNKNVQDYRKYSTEPADFQTWLDRVYQKLNFSLPTATLLIGIAVYLIGLSFAATFDFGRAYINSSAICIGVAGICLVTGVVRYASLNIHRVFENIRPCFMIEDAAYSSFIKRWFTRLSNNANLIAAGVYVLLALLVAYAEFFSPLTGRVQVGAMKTYFFESFWYGPDHLWEKAFLIAFFGICVALPLGTATRLLYLNFLFMQEVKDLPVVPLIKTTRLRFREVVDYYRYIYFTWSIGIGLFGIVFFMGLQIDSILFLTALNLLGIGAFISPQLCYRSFILQSIKAFTNRTLKKFHSSMGVALHERPSASKAGAENAFRNGAREAAQESINWWVYGVPDIALFILGQTFVYGATFLQG